MIEFVVAQQVKLESFVRSLFEREEGQDMVEYALLAALISIAAIVVILLIGPVLTKIFGDVVNGLNGA